jgi:thioredoxin-related protein
MPLPDGRIICTTYNWNDSEGTSYCELIKMTKTDAAQVQDKIILTYACMYMDYNIRGQIIEFNKTNSEYRIEVHDLFRVQY